MKMLSLSELATLVDGNKACRFASITYKAKGTGEVARHTVLLNVKRERCLKVDLEYLKKLRDTLSEVARQACDELIASITETLETGTNSQHTKAGYYAAVGNGNVQVGETGTVYIRGYNVRKTVMVEGEKKMVNSSRKTIEKNKLRKSLKNTRIREFRIDPNNFNYAKLNGKTIEIVALGDNLSSIPDISLVNTPDLVTA
jgi:hypothetical protein